MNSYLAFNVISARKKYKIEYPALYAPAGHKDEMAFNSVQRAHQNTLESYSLVMLQMMCAGLKYPITSAVCGAIWVGGRVVYGYGASTAVAHSFPFCTHLTSALSLVDSVMQPCKRTTCPNRLRYGRAQRSDGGRHHLALGRYSSCLRLSESGIRPDVKLSMLLDRLSSSSQHSDTHTYDVEPRPTTRAVRMVRMRKTRCKQRS